MNISALVTEIAPELYGCPEPLVARCVRDAAMDLFKFSGAWTVEQGPEPVVAGTFELPLNPPPGTILNVIRGVRIGKRPLASVTQAQRYSSSLLQSEPSVYYLNSGNRIAIQPAAPVGFTPANAYILYCVTPTTTLQDIPDNLYAEYYDTLASGAKARAMRMPGQVWTNLALSREYAIQFAGGRSGARLDAERDRVTYRARINTPGFGRLHIEPLGDFPMNSDAPVNLIFGDTAEQIVDEGGNSLVFN